MSIPGNIPPVRYLPRFGYLFPNWSNVTPFTYQDGQTAAKMLESMIAFIDNTLVPYVDEEFERVINAWKETVTTLIQALVDDSVTLQDPVLAGILTDLDSDSYGVLAAYLDAVVTEKDADLGVFLHRGSESEFELVGVDEDSNFPTRVMERLTVLFEAKDYAYSKAYLDALTEGAGRLSIATLNTRFNAKADLAAFLDLDAAFDLLDLDVTTAEGKIAVLELLVASGRLSQSALDAAYVNTSLLTHAVMIGTSNSVVATGWPADWADRQNLTLHNYSVGGGGFTAGGSAKFSAQLAAALADVSFNKAHVGMFIIGDCGNDVRGEADVTAEATALFTTIRAQYPNARIIVIPALWGHSTDNLFGNRIASILRRYQEIQDAGSNEGVELVPFSWTWHFDKTAWMDGDSVHYTQAGYDRVGEFLDRYLLGAPTDSPVGWKLGTPGGGVGAWGDYMYLRSSREGNTARLEGSFRVPEAGVGLDGLICTVQQGTSPFQTKYFTATSQDNRNTVVLAWYPNGGVQAFGGIPIDASGGGFDTYWVNETAACF